MLNIESGKLYINGVHLFDYPNINVNDGDVVGLIGDNGTGKTTFINQLCKHLNAQTISNFDGTFELVEQIQPIVDTGSGGEITKYAIMQALHKVPALLILDEPSTNLDVVQQKWLSQQIKNYHGMVILITHDEKLLKLVNRIWAIQNHQLSEFNGNYATYLKEQASQKNSQLVAYKEQKNKINRLKQQVIKRKQAAQRIKHGNGKKMSSSEFKTSKTRHDSMEKKMQKKATALKTRIDKLDKLIPPKHDKEIKFIDPAGQQFMKKTVLHVRKMDVKFKKTTLISQVNLSLKYGEHVNIQGVNGSGKTTFIKQILASKDYFNQSISIGYFDQLNQNLVLTQSVWQNSIADSTQDNQVVFHVLSALGLLAFKDRLAMNLSGGQKVRLQLAKVLLGSHQVIILDEPTNYLDLKAKQALITFLNNYPGSVILISHDVAFTNQIKGKTYFIKNKRWLDSLSVQTFSNRNKGNLMDLKYRLDAMIQNPDTDIEDIRKIRQQIDDLTSGR
ncbi:ATP-binding cassette domain-containing protein [Apilactobacillus xinyiensis]|uniref:ATP-binding cassette domain-containing protein n=1 Tax=Apilactobacillus xinyiensis TaxID=2841032 RepID=UPI001C7D8F33|nr:ATP-binding cassette domain-containing protein [Apilactobacillus xinyiensis]